jgi:hypothetical protein
MTSKDSVIRHTDSPASSTNYTSERRLDKAGEGERERIVVGGGEWPAIYEGFNFHVINTNPKSMRHLMVYTHLILVNSFTFASSSLLITTPSLLNGYFSFFLYTCAL